MTTGQEKSQERLLALVSWVNSERSQGWSKNEVRPKLAKMGLTDASIDSILALSDRSLGDSLTIRGKARSYARLAAIVVAVFAALNLVLYLGQEAYWADEVRECRQIETDLAAIKSKLVSLEQKIGRQRSLAQQIESTERTLSTSWTTDMAARYQALVATYNENLADTRTAQRQYSSLVAEHNRAADNYNRLAAKAFTRYYLIPVPGHSGKHASSHSPVGAH